MTTPKDNRTLKYLNQRFLFSYETFDLLRKLPTKGMYIADCNWYMNIKKELNIKNYIFIQIDTNGHFDNEKKVYTNVVSDYKKGYFEAIEFLKKDPHFVENYWLDILTNNDQVIVMELPVKDSVKKFLKGEYSTIYTEEQIEKVWFDISDNEVLSDETKKYRSDTKNVLYGKDTELSRDYLIKSFELDSLSLPNDLKEFDMPAYFIENLKHEVLNWTDSIYEWLNMDQYAKVTEEREQSLEFAKEKLINLDSKNYEDHIKISKSGEALPLSNKGRVIIDTLNLNGIQLIEERKLIEERLIELEREVIDTYQKVNSEYFENFKSALNTIRKLNSFSQVAKDDIEKYLKNMLYANAVTCLETFLADAFNSTLQKDKKFLRNFVEGFRDFNEDKFSLREIYQKYDTIEHRVTEALSTIMWHNLAKVSGIYLDTFGINFLPAPNIFRAILIRHDLVHRNGKSKTGKFHLIQNSDIESICSDIENFVMHIYKQIIALNIPVS